MATATISHVSHVLAVPDAMATARWWIEAMKFEWLQDLGGWVFVGRGPCRIMLGSCPDAVPVPDLGDHQYFAYIVLDDLDAYRAEIDAARVDIVREPADMPWGMREMAVRTPDGHRLMFAQPVA